MWGTAKVVYIKMRKIKSHMYYGTGKLVSFCIWRNTLNLPFMSVTIRYLLMHLNKNIYKLRNSYIWFIIQSRIKHFFKKNIKTGEKRYTYKNKGKSLPYSQRKTRVNLKLLTFGGASSDPPESQETVTCLLISILFLSFCWSFSSSNIVLKIQKTV